MLEKLLLESTIKKTRYFLDNFEVRVWVLDLRVYYFKDMDLEVFFKMLGKYI